MRKKTEDVSETKQTRHHRKLQRDGAQASQTAVRSGGLADEVEHGHRSQM